MMGPGEVSGTNSVSANDINSIKHSAAETSNTAILCYKYWELIFSSGPDYTQLEFVMELQPA